MYHYCPVKLLHCVCVQHELVALDASDTLHCDHLMTRFKLQPGDLKLVIPSYFTRDRRLELLEVRGDLYTPVGTH